ncbi:MAG: DUF2273 domain-containing protein [Aerococcus sp.]|nr:DUF2273 domain-containing protein [Aerococcus sp.]
MNQWLRYWNTYRGRVIGTLVFFVGALLLVTVGFFRTLAIVLLTIIGYLVGEYFDGGSTLQRWLRSWRRR